MNKQRAVTFPFRCALRLEKSARTRRIGIGIGVSTFLARGASPSTGKDYSGTGRGTRKMNLDPPCVLVLLRCRITSRGTRPVLIKNQYTWNNNQVIRRRARSRLFRGKSVALIPRCWASKIVFRCTEWLLVRGTKSNPVERTTAKPAWRRAARKLLEQTEQNFSIHVSQRRYVCAYFPRRNKKKEKEKQRKRKMKIILRCGGTKALFNDISCNAFLTSSRRNQKY